MKTAQCALTLDTSRFDGPIERSKAKLVDFSVKVANLARTAKAAFDSASQVSAQFLTIREAVKAVANDIINYRQRLDKLREAYLKLKEIGGQVLASLKSLPEGFKKSAVATIALGVGAIEAYKAIKTLGATMSDVAVKTRTAFSSAMTGAGDSLSKLASKLKYGLLAIAAGFTAIAGGSIVGVS